MPELDTALDRSSLSLDRIVAALVTAGTMKLDPLASKAILLVFCAGQEPAEA
jgi:hypothetical protein|tara:strand:- start:1321 stop:1476 length:156 start_codon:yes stop_codon:yes gene_type:complete